MKEMERISTLQIRCGIANASRRSFGRAKEEYRLLQCVTYLVRKDQRTNTSAPTTEWAEGYVTGLMEMCVAPSGIFQRGCYEGVPSTHFGKFCTWTWSLYHLKMGSFPS